MPLTDKALRHALSATFRTLTLLGGKDRTFWARTTSNGRLQARRPAKAGEGTGGRGQVICETNRCNLVRSYIGGGKPSNCGRISRRRGADRGMETEDRKLIPSGRAAMRDKAGFTLGPAEARKQYECEPRHTGGGASMRRWVATGQLGHDGRAYRRGPRLRALT